MTPKVLGIRGNVGTEKSGCETKIIEKSTKKAGNIETITMKQMMIKRVPY